jgi:epoxyqueuosine reductase
VVRVTQATLPDEVGARLADSLAQGHHGDMDWLAQHPERRADPRTLWPEAKSVVMLGMSYAPEGDPLAGLNAPDTGVISVYARSRDYHDVIKGKLKTVAGVLAAEGAAVKVFVDTAPVMEKPLAQAAGLGWQGKHTVLVSRAHGSWLFLGAIFTDADLEPDAPERDHCGSCRRCIAACPTDAFPEPYVLDSRRCIAYLTIEHKGPIPREFRAPMGNRIFGCDDCLAVCPWNTFATATREAKLQARDALQSPDLAALLALDDARFRTLFAGTPVKRTGHARFLRNVLIAAGNSGHPALRDAVSARLSDPSPLIRGAAIWAYSRLAPKESVTAAAERALPHETDPDVRREWLEAQ